MQLVLQGLNPQEGPDFVSVYLDFVLIFSETLDEHQEHLEPGIRCVEEAGMKLKLSKCQFVREDVKYLGYIITPEGLKTNPKLVDTVK